MPKPNYKDELRGKRFPVDGNTRPVAVLYTYDPATGEFVPLAQNILDGAAVSAVLPLTTVAVVARAGAANLELRKSVVIQALSANVVWGFSAENMPFTLDNGGKASLDLGPNVDLWVAVSTGTGSCAVAEVS